jgi:uncharacterized protein (DUF2235 family)
VRNLTFLSNTSLKCCLGLLHIRDLEAGAPMAKKIVLFSDGTGNSSAKGEKTNVWRLFEALNQTNTAQIAKYDDGVGTSSIKFLAAIGGAFGWGLKRNVLDLYKFVCRNYETSSEIFGFGFSRGAFTIRVLVGLIVNQGLVGYRSEAELDRNAIAAYRRYRAERFTSINPLVSLLRWLRDRVIAFVNWVRGYDAKTAPPNIGAPHSVPIKFLGLWDTVEAYGMPVAELKRGIDRWIWPMVFGDKSLSPLVERACHALSLDDERATFHPLLWDEEAEAKMIAGSASKPEPQRLKAGRLTQVWFAGVHSNVGGGYPEDQLSLVPLEWMMHEAKESGLDLEPTAIREVSEAKSPYARLYDSRAGTGVFYRYEPRRTADKSDVFGAEILPVIDSSVIMRIAFGSDHYAPITLPHQFWVMAPDGRLVPMHGPGGRLDLDTTKQIAGSVAIANKKPTAQIAAELKSFAAAIKLLGDSDLDAIRLVWDTVWWRRVNYFITMALAAILVSYPWLGEQYANAVKTGLSSLPIVGDHLASLYSQNLGEVDQGAGGLIASIVDAVGGLIPSYLSSWTRTLIDYPVEFGSTAIGLLFCLALSSTLQSRIQDRARLAWRGALREDYLKWSYDRDAGAKREAAVAFVIACVALSIAWLQGWRFPIPLEIGIIALLFGLLLLWRIISVRNFRRAAARSGGQKNRLPSSRSLAFARSLRDCVPLVTLNRWFAWELIPALFALAVVIIAIAVTNRVTFDVASSMGAFCKGSVHGDDLKREKLGAAAMEFHTDRICWPSGLVLNEKHLYRITLDAPHNDWFDKSIRTDVGGFATDSFRHFSASLLKRWWRENWFQPIGRINELGNDEYVLAPDEPFDPAPATYKECHTQKSIGEEANSAKISDDAATELAACAIVPPGRRKLTARVTAKTSGELFIYVNDAVVSWPGKTDYFYQNNRGTAIVSVARIDE